MFDLSTDRPSNCGVDSSRGACQKSLRSCPAADDTLAAARYRSEMDDVALGTLRGGVVASRASIERQGVDGGS